MNRPKNILITGATGGIGIELLRQLKKSDQLDGISVLARDSKKNRIMLASYANLISIFWGDLMDEASLVPACKNQEVVIHLAGLIPPAFHEDDARSLKINVEGTRNVISTLEEHSPNAFLIFSSSVVVYGDRLKTPEINVGDPLDPEQYDQYGIAKIETEKDIQNSKLNWTILRLSAIMGIGNHKVSGIIFHVPLDTPMEICTMRDTARAFVNAPNNLDQLNKRIFNLGGGSACRISYHDFLARAFKSFGMGKVNFPKYTFATMNFHCGYYMDGDDLEDILHFQSDTLDTYFERFHASVSPIQRFFTRPFAGIAKWYLRTLSEPYKAYKSRNNEEMIRFFGTTNLKEDE
ncbi:MAG: NAD(P)-dependent oxidoreductase [Crocinitomicaceae bacterium]|nr:NAD(P)-dependent oxidoreductase [Crocinitomicaceae bacterium]